MSSKIKKRSKSRNKSMKTVVEDAPTTQEKKGQKKQIVRFVTRTLEKGVSGLRAEFTTLKRFNDFEKMKAFKEAQEDGRNRYKDVGCLDNSRVKLTSPWPHEYIHANFVSTPSNPKRFICTQAPLEKTCADFWYMCLQERVETIFMLCNLLEKGAKKCHEYYPTKKMNTLEFEEQHNKITVKYESSRTFKFRNKDVKAEVIETIVLVEGMNDSIKTTHYHWVDWPDRAVPPPDLAILELLEKARPSKGPIVVHCSAGVGRTGSVVMIEYIMDQLTNKEAVDDGDKILSKIREQRNNSVQTEMQYLFVHQVMLNYFNSKKLLDSNAKEVHASFTAEYVKIIH